MQTFRALANDVPDLQGGDNVENDDEDDFSNSSDSESEAGKTLPASAIEFVSPITGSAMGRDAYHILK